MIKIILQMACSLLFIFALTSGVSIQFKPFHISFAYPFFGLGMVLITIGFALCVGSFYYKGIKDSGYEEGYSKGFDAGTEYVIDLIKDKEKGDE